MASTPSKVRLREVATGTVIERFPVDARDILKAPNSGYELCPGENLQVTVIPQVAIQQPNIARPAKQQGKVLVREKLPPLEDADEEDTRTPQVVERWPVDAREMVKSGNWEYVLPEGSDVVAPAPVLNPGLQQTHVVDPAKGAPGEYAPGVPLKVATTGAVTPVTATRSSRGK